MRNVLLASLIAVFFSNTAYAGQYLNVTIQFETSEGQSNPSRGVLLDDTSTITFVAAGKTCTLIGYTSKTAPLGCNYDITVAPDGSVSGTLQGFGKYCTAPSAIPSSCK